MKLKSFQLEKMLGSLKGVLIYGTDTGAITQAAQTVLKKLGVEKDAFAVIKMDMDRLSAEPTAFADELNAIGLFSSSRVIYFKNPTDLFLKEAEQFIDSYEGNTFVLMTSDSLNTKSKLVKAFDAAGNVGAIGCYPATGTDIRSLIQTTLTKGQITITPEAMSLLSSYLETDRGIVISELEKLCLYMGDKKQVTAEDVVMAVGNGLEVGMDDLIYAVFGGQHARMQQVFDLMLSEGIQGVQIMRAFILKMNTLLLIFSKIRNGDSPEAAIKSTSPFIPFKYKAVWRSVVMRWNEKAAKDGLALLLDAERNCKTGLPAEVICNRALTVLTNAGRKLLKA